MIEEARKTEESKMMAGGSERLLEIRDLCVEYRANEETIQAVNGLLLELRKGECLGLVGETGAGKTTTALSILGLLPARTGFITEGQIFFNGRNLRALRPMEMRAIRGSGIGMVFQDPMTSLNPILSVGRQIEESLQYHNENGLSAREIEGKVDEFLELVGISAARKHEYPHQFSGGMMQRVCIAMALIGHPELIIADEPTTALDVTIQAQVLNIVNELRLRLQAAVLLITHDLGIVARMCQHVALMYAGEIIEFGPAEAIFHAARHHPYTEGLFRCIPNLMQKSRRLHSIPGLMPDPTRLPIGCAFYPRCSERLEICKDKKPAYAQEPEGHRIKCCLFSETKNDKEEC